MPNTSISKEISISMQNVSKYYKLYNDPKDRLKEALSLTSKTYHKKFYATKNLDLEIKKGEILGIVGKNGSGKSTLLKIITGVLKPNEGEVHVDGKISALLELGSGFNPEFTGMQNIFFYGTVLGFTKKEMKEKIDEILAFADIGDFIDQPIKTYSSGMKARLGFAVAVHIDPEILILDEVLAVGDILFKRKCYAKMEEFFKGGKTIIYVSHDANSVNQLCTRAVLLHNGKIILDGTPKNVTNYYQKLIFSKNPDTILDEIKTENISTDIPQKSDAAAKEDHLVNKDKYIPGMISNPKILKNYDVEIFDIKIINENNEKVNILNIDHKYCIHYKIEFNIDCEEVKFGHLIKTDKGLIISGETLPGRKNTIPLVKKGQVFTVESSFMMQLTPGTYFMDIGATTDIDHKKVYLNMKYDILLFKVEGEKFNYWGLSNIWFDQRIINGL